jgi:thiosulfate reductase cytochrome b subunit
VETHDDERVRKSGRSEEARLTGERAPGGFIYRHAGLVRVTHWINVVCFSFLLMSGLNIFNAHPALYFGSESNFDHPAFSIDSKDGPSGPIGVTTIAGHTFDTTGVLGVSKEDGESQTRGFPAWSTVPAEYDLATARRWHFIFAWIFVVNGFAYLIFGFASRHVQRDLVPRRADLAHLGTTILDHLRLHFPHGAEAERYNVLQMSTYLIVACILLPLMVLAGWSMSPGLDALLPFLPEAFGGRQSARSVHFIVAWLLVLFVLVHIAMVLVSGVWNNLRSMVTGWYRT